MRGVKRLKILYLNVNGFFGDSSIKSILARNKCLCKVKNCREDGLNRLISDLLIEKILTGGEEYDIIFLSEFDPQSSASIKFISEMKNNEYDYILPNAIKGEIKDTITSITVCFIKNEKKEQWLDNNKSNKNIEDYLVWCEIGGKQKETPYITGVHFISEEKMNAFIEEVKEKSYKDKDFIIFGDFNANSKKEMEKGNNNFFQELIDELKEFGAKEVKDNDNKNTYRGITKIDRVITNMKDINVEIDESFFKEGMSDHAAIVITLPNYE